jgi:hypothetical protein
MTNSIKSIEFFKSKMVRITKNTLGIEKSFYRKNMELNHFAVKKINEMISLILRKQGFNYVYDIEYLLNGTIKINISWEDQNFDGYSDYYNVYDFDNYFGDYLQRLVNYINEEYDQLICIT